MAGHHYYPVAGGREGVAGQHCPVAGEGGGGGGCEWGVVE